MKTTTELLLLIFALVFLCSDFVNTKEHKEDKLHDSHHKGHESRKHVGVKHSKQHLKTREFSVQRCYVICPIEVACFGQSGGNIINPVSPTTKHPVSTSTLTTTEEITKEPEGSTLPSNSSEPSARKAHKLKFRYGFHSHNPINFNHPSLNRVWKRKLLEKLKSPNTRTKPTYKFRQFSPNNCYVACHSALSPSIISPPGVILPAESIDEDPGSDSNSDSSEEEDEHYEEGEDDPVEVTMSPPDNRKNSHIKTKHQHNIHKENKL